MELILKGRVLTVGLQQVSKGESKKPFREVCILVERPPKAPEVVKARVWNDTDFKAGADTTVNVTVRAFKFRSGDVSLSVDVFN